MKAKEVMRLLRVSRGTLKTYRDKGFLKADKQPNGYFNYDESSVYAFLNKDIPRKNYIYARVSTNKQKKDLENQINLLKSWCFSSGYRIDGIFSDIASGISFEKRRHFFEMMDDILEHKVENIIIAYKDRLSRVGFDLFYYLFKQVGTNIIIVSEIGNPKLDSEEIFEEIISLLHCYSMKLYSKRRNRSIEVGLKDV